MHRLGLLLLLFFVGAAEGLDWWQKSIIYQIYPRSFQDSDVDGVGDLKGITSRLDYLSYINVGAIWLSPMYTSPMKDFGYDVANHTEVDPLFGDLNDLDELIKEAHQRDIRVILDFIPNHTSDLHPWFQQSKKGGKDNRYSDYYVWDDGVPKKDGTRAPPTNWVGVFGGSMWEWDEGRQQFYLHQFIKEQPDLNYRNPQVQKDMKEVLRYWCERGVDGFRVDAIGTLFEAEPYRDEPKSHAPGVTRSDQYEYYSHIYTNNQPEIHDVVSSWRDVLDQCGKTRGQHIFMVLEIYDETQVESMKYYYSGADVPFNFNLINVTPDCGGTCIKVLIDDWMNNMPTGKWPNFVLGNHDRKRITSRKGELYDRAMNMLLLSLPGTPTTYYGEEIGLLDIKLSYEQTKDPWAKYFGPEMYEQFSRDPCRAPMQWTTEKNSGFSSAEDTWLPVHEDYVWRNAESQIGDLNSVLEAYTSMAKLRDHPDFQNPEMTYAYVDGDVISYYRKQQNNCGHLVIINLGKSVSVKDYSVTNNNCDTRGVVTVTTGNIEDETLGLQVGRWVSLSNIHLNPGEGVILQLKPLHTEL